MATTILPRTNEYTCTVMQGEEERSDPKGMELRAMALYRVLVGTGFYGDILLWSLICIEL